MLTMLVSIIWSIAGGVVEMSGRKKHVEIRSCCANFSFHGVYDANLNAIDNGLS